MVPLGLKKGMVKVFPHQESWHANFDKQKALILGLENKHIRAVEHVGSTSVRGMPAKPIIDLIVGIDTYANTRKLVNGLKRVGYEFRLEPRRYQSLFVKVEGTRETHYLKVLRYRGKWWNQYLEFKNKLIHDKKAFNAYRTHKMRSGEVFADNRKAYTKSKAELITKILAE